MSVVARIDGGLSSVGLLKNDLLVESVWMFSNYSENI